MTSPSRLVRLAAFALATLGFAPLQAEMTEVVCLDTNYGEICLRLFPEDAPQTVQNFLNYVNRGDYDATFFHRLVSGFVLQGGGFFFTASEGPGSVPADPPVVNEFRRSNLRGTVAMAKLGNNPNSATNQWFINLDNNGTKSPFFLDLQNGGFTVFGEVVLDGMKVVDAIAGTPIVNLSSLYGGTFQEVPLANLDSVSLPGDYVTLKRAYVTQRDLENPANNPDPRRTTTTYAGHRFLLPVLHDGAYYQMIFNQTSASPDYVFRVNTAAITTYNPTGEPVAEFSRETGLLTVPSARIAPLDRVFTNVVLRLTNAATLEFTLLSYERQPDE